ncbi:MAG: hypothetical protein N3I35_12230 [Clostridia bacterium]|nr:hypothetical protein [Clostridia bacterium]
MVKKICFMLVFLILFSVCSISVFAAPDESGYDADTKATKEKYVTITKPEDGKNEITYNKSYSICGVTELENIRVELHRLNEDKKKYEKIVIDGKSYWDIGESGFFAKEIDLKEGNNKIMLVAYKISDDKKNTDSRNEQRSIFEIKRDKRNLLESIKDKIFDPLKSLFE